MGQDSEAAAEFVATVRGDHAKMKEWYGGSAPAALRDKYGDYPSLWKEVLNWPGWKETRKEYLKHTQQNEQTSGNNDATGGDGGGDGGSIPRKRKSRWGNKSENSNNSEGGSRFGPPPEKRPSVGVPPPLNIPGLGVPTNNLTPQQQEELARLQAQLRHVNERLDNLEREAARVDALPRGHRERSPSPPPGESIFYFMLPGLIRLGGPYSVLFTVTYTHLSLSFSLLNAVYGADGKRKNTRAVRWRERYTVERQDLLEAIMRLRGGGRQSSQLLVRKRVKKIPIPIEKHPNYNFIGLIIGPRGKTQKELEAKTGCKIAIRGRGSVKEGARGRRDGKIMEGDNEPLHVVVSGDNQKGTLSSLRKVCMRNFFIEFCKLTFSNVLSTAVDAATDMVTQMLVVIDDEKNVHKQQQLRELALLNGTLKDDEFCEICAEKGHRAFACPKRFAMRKNTPAIKCAICGDTSHPTSDCTRKQATVAENRELDSEYQSFMAELDGKKPEGRSAMSPGDNRGPPAPPVGLPPPPPANLPPPLPAAASLPPPPPANLPPPPTNTARSPADNSYYNRPPTNGYGHPPVAPGYGQQQTPPNAYGNQQQQYQGYGQQQQQQQQQPAAGHGQQRQVRPGEETAGWDPSSYYGSYGGGAGGFNWWDK